MAEFELKGMDALFAKFDAAKNEVRYKGGRVALRKAANFIADKVRQGAQKLDDPATAEVIAKNVAVRWNSRRHKASGDLAFRVGILGGAKPSDSRDAIRSAARRRKKGISSLGDLGEIVGRGKANPGGDTFYWRFVEFGTQNNPARPFIRPAIQNHQTEAINVFAKSFEKALDAAIRKANKAK